MHRLALVLTLVSGVVAGCGGSDSESREDSATPAEAVGEIARIRTLLDDAVADYRAGRGDAAEETVGDAYLEHFELVEPPLEERDEELNEELELLISTEIRKEIKEGVPPAEVKALVAEANIELTKAEKALEG